MIREDLTDSAFEKIFSPNKRDPNDQIGEVMTLDGVDYLILGLLGEGATKIVYSVRKLSTNEEFALALWYHKPSPEEIYSNQAKDATEKHDWDRLFRLSEYFLTLHPSAEPAMFNMGVALMGQEKYEPALDAFSLALSLNPKDVINWVHRAIAQGRLGNSSEMIKALIVAENINSSDLQGFLAKARALSKQISYMLRAITGTQFEVEAAQHFLELLKPSNLDAYPIVDDDQEPQKTDLIEHNPRNNLSSLELLPIFEADDISFSELNISGRFPP